MPNVVAYDNTIENCFTSAGVGFTGQTGELFGEFDLTSLLSLVLMHEPAAAWAISLLRLKRDRNMSSSLCLSICVFLNILFSNSWVG